jgi:hypothetical protein
MVVISVLLVAVFGSLSRHAFCKSPLHPDFTDFTDFLGALHPDFIAPILKTLYSDSIQ